MKLEATRERLVLLLLCVWFLGCTGSRSQNLTSVPGLIPWFNSSTCQFARNASDQNPLAGSLARFCTDSAPATQTVIVAQLDAANRKGVATCKFADTRSCEILVEFCDHIGGVGFCERQECYCEWEIALR